MCASSPVSVGVVSHHLFDHSIGRMLATLLSQLSTSPHLNVTLFTTATPSPNDQVRRAEKRAVGDGRSGQP